MKARTTFLIFAFSALAAALLALAGCPASIYYTLENEVKTTDNTLSNDLWIHSVAKLGTAYYAAAGKVFKTSSTSPVTWDSANLLTPPVGGLCNTMVAFGGNLYGGFITQGGSLGLYEATGPSPTAFATAVAAFAGRQISCLGVVRGGADIAVVTADWDPTNLVYKYNLYVNALVDTSGHLMTDCADKITGLAYTSASGSYWAVAGSTLYEDGIPATVTGTVSGEVLNSVFSDDETNRLWVTSDKGYVYYSPDAGTTWYRNATAAEVSGYTVSFMTMAGASGSSSMLVGAEGQTGGYGYYVVSVSGTTVTLTRFSESTIPLYVASVRGFLIDGARLFAYCFGVDRGLWRNESFNSADCSVTTGTWVQE
jgi:hypothetical protein